MRLFKSLSFVCIITLILSSCSNDSGLLGQKESIFAHYKLTYNASQYETVASAEFYEGNEGGSKLDLGFTVPAKITFADQENVKYDAKQLVFYKDYNGKLSQIKVKFFYTAGIVEYVNYIFMAKDISIPTSVTTLTKADGLKFTFGGASVGVDEKVVLKVGNLIFANTTVGSNEFDIKASELATLSPGNIQISISRHKWGTAKEGTPAGGKVEGIFNAAPKTIAVI